MSQSARETFAAAALTGLLANGQLAEARGGYLEIAKKAFWIADAMLEAGEYVSFDDEQQTSNSLNAAARSATEPKSTRNL